MLDIETYFKENKIKIYYKQQYSHTLNDSISTTRYSFELNISNIEYNVLCKTNIYIPNVQPPAIGINKLTQWHDMAWHGSYLMSHASTNSFRQIRTEIVSVV